MPRDFFHDRYAGLLVPLFSIASRRSWGIGELMDLPALGAWMSEAGFAFVQLLPLNEMADGQNSPYSALSAMAIDPIFIAPRAVPDLQALGVEAVLSDAERADLEAVRAAPSIDYARVRELKTSAFRAAFARFVEHEWKPKTPRARRLQRFTERSRWWLDAYTLFRALHARFEGRAWTEWDAPLRDRDPGALAAARAELADEIRFYAYLQWLAAEQWTEARETAEIGVFGDFPFMVSRDSADVWSRQDDFRMDASVGAPPDAFSETGQDWGFPAYRWPEITAGGFQWLAARARRNAEIYDAYRVDHLVGFFRTYVREIEKIPWMCDDGVTFEELEHERFLAARGRNAKHGRPAAVRRQDVHDRRGAGQAAQRGVVAADAREDGVAHRPGAAQERARGDLHRRRDREVGVGDQLEPLERLRHHIVRPVERDPSQLDLRQPRALRQPAETRDETARRAQGRRLDERIAERIVPEHLVHDQRRVALGASRRQLIGIGSGQHRARRVVRTDGEHRARVAAPYAIERRRIDRPRAVILERITPLADAVEAGEMIEQRIAGRRRQHVGPSGIAEQLEEDGVRFTGARCEHDPFPIDREAAPRVGVGDGSARVFQPERFRTVHERGGIGERVQQIGGIRDAGARRVRDREIEQRPARPRRLERAGDARRRTIVGHAPREHPLNGIRGSPAHAVRVRPMTYP